MVLPKRLNDDLHVFTQEETPLVRATACLYDFDAMPSVRSGRLLVAPTFTFERLVVPVYEGTKPIGAATLYQQGRKVGANITFDYATPERLDLMLGQTIWAIPRGTYFLDPTNPRWYIVDLIDVEGVDLSISPSKSPGIGSRVLANSYIMPNVTVEE